VITAAEFEQLGHIMPLDILIICGGEAHHGPDRIWEGDL